MFVVYYVYVDNVLSYIGEGKLGRESHANSGVSNVYELNKAHFLGKEINIEIKYRFSSKEESVNKEREEIIINNPPFNIKHTEKDGRIKESQFYLRISRSIKEAIIADAKRVGKHEKGEYWAARVSDMFKKFGVKAFVEGISCPFLYKTGVAKHLAYGSSPFIKRFFNTKEDGRNLVLILDDEYLRELNNKEN